MTGPSAEKHTSPPGELPEVLGAERSMGVVTAREDSRPTSGVASRARAWLPTGPRAGALVALAWILYGLATVHVRGVTVDAPSLFFAGDRIYFWLLHRRVDQARDLWAPDPPGFHSNFDRDYSASADRVHFPVFPSFVAAAAADLFSHRLRWVDDVDGHLLGLIALHALGLFLFGLAAVQLLGPWAGLWAALTYLLFPTIVGHAFNNPKDLPCTDFYAVALLVGARGVLDASPRKILWAGALFGLSLSAKFNAVFGILTLYLWLPAAFLLTYRGRREVTPGLAAALVLVPHIAFACFVFLWPWLTHGTLADTINHIADYHAFIVGRGVSDRPGWTGYGFRCLWFMTPPLVLLAAAAGVLIGRKRTPAERSVFLLLLLWIAVPLLRVSLPHSDFYDANRHFIEHIPALCCLAGLGFAAIGDRLNGLLSRGVPWIAGALGVAALAVLCLPLIEYAPYEAAYFNAFIGGLGGAQRAALLRVPPPHPGWVNGTEGDYWNSSLRSAMRLFLDMGLGTGDMPAVLAICGGGAPPLAQGEMPPRGLPRVVMLNDVSGAPYVYANPRESHCSWDTVRGLERERPVLYREERGGGLIYELLGPKAAYPLPPVSPLTAYNSSR